MNDGSKTEMSRTCETCAHNYKERAICWMWGCPPDNKGTFGFAERCQYYTEEIPKKKAVWEEIKEGFEYTPLSIKVKRETLEKLVDYAGERGLTSAFTKIFSSFIRNDFGHTPNKLDENQDTLHEIVKTLVTHDYVGVEWEVEIINATEQEETYLTFIVLRANHHVDEKFVRIFLVDENDKLTSFHFSKKAWRKFSFKKNHD